MNDDRKWVGKHFIQHLPPDVIYVVYEGDVSQDEARVISEFYTEKVYARDSRFLIDVRRMGAMGSEARRELAMNRRPAPGGTSMRIALGFIGATMRARVLMTVVVAAARVVKEADMSTHFFRDIAAAADWARIDAGMLGAR